MIRSEKHMFMSVLVALDKHLISSGRWLSMHVHMGALAIYRPGCIVAALKHASCNTSLFIPLVHLTLSMHCLVQMEMLL